MVFEFFLMTTEFAEFGVGLNQEFFYSAPSAMSPLLDQHNQNYHYKICGRRIVARVDFSTFRQRVGTGDSVE